MDKTKAINPSNKAKLVIAVQRYRDHMETYREGVGSSWEQRAEKLRSDVAVAAIEFVLSEEG